MSVSESGSQAAVVVAGIGLPKTSPWPHISAGFNSEPLTSCRHHAGQGSPSSLVYNCKLFVLLIVCEWDKVLVVTSHVEITSARGLLIVLYNCYFCLSPSLSHSSFRMGFTAQSTQVILIIFEWFVVSFVWAPHPQRVVRLRVVVNKWLNTLLKGFALSWCISPGTRSARYPYYGESDRKLQKLVRNTVRCPDVKI